MKSEKLKSILKGIWALTLSTASATRQTLSKLSLLSLLWQFCSFLFVPQWGRSRKTELRNNGFMEMKR